jgi:hypothetical protein
MQKSSEEIERLTVEKTIRKLLLDNFKPAISREVLDRYLQKTLDEMNAMECPLCNGAGIVDREEK